MRFLLLLLFVLGPGPVLAGWHSGLRCHETAIEAAAEACSGLLLSSGSNTDWIRCRTVDVSACAATPAVGALCDVPAVTQRLSMSANTSSATSANNSNFLSLHGCEPSTDGGLTAAKVSDYMELWGLFFAACVGVLALKAVYQRFRIDHAGG